MLTKNQREEIALRNYVNASKRWFFIIIALFGISFPQLLNPQPCPKLHRVDRQEWTVNQILATPTKGTDFVIFDAHFTNFPPFSICDRQTQQSWDWFKRFEPKNSNPSHKAQLQINLNFIYYLLPPKKNQAIPLFSLCMNIKLMNLLIWKCNQFLQSYNLV